MTKQDLVRDMKQSFNGAGLLTITQLAKYRNEHYNTTAIFLKGMEYTTEGKKKMYFVGDVADRILAKRHIGF